MTPFYDAQFNGVVGRVIITDANGPATDNTSDATNKSYVSESGAYHAVVSGAPVLTGNGTVRPGASGATMAAAWAMCFAPSPDYDVELTVKLASAVAFDGVGVMGRMASNTTGYMAFLYNGTLKLYKCTTAIDTSQTQLGSTYTVTPADGDKVTLQMRGSSIKVLLNGVVRVTATDTTYATAGQIGLAAITVITAPGNSTGMQIDRVRAIAANEKTIDGTYIKPNIGCRLTAENRGVLRWHGGGIKFACTGSTSASIKLDSAVLAKMIASDGSGAYASNKYPKVRVFVDGVGQTPVQLTAATDRIVITGLSTTGTRQIEVVLTSTMIGQYSEGAAITGVQLDGDGSFVAPTLQPYRWLHFGDSISCGTAINDANNNIDSNDFSACWVRACAAAISAEVDNKSVPGIGVNQATAWQTPTLTNFWNRDNPSQATTWGTYDLVTLLMGENDNGGNAITQSQATNLLTAMRAAFPTSNIVWIIPFSGKNKTAIIAGVAACNDSKIIYIDKGTTGTGWVASGANSYDGVHPSASISGTIGAAMAVDLAPYIVGPAAPTVTARAGDGSVIVTWTAVSGAAGYRLYRDNVQVYDGTALSYTDTGRTNGAVYTYTVKAYSSTGALSLASSTSTVQPRLSRIWSSNVWQL